jgi:pilus assembly protein CpaF
VVGPRDEGSEMLMSALCAAASRDRVVVVSDHDGLALELGAAHVDVRHGDVHRLVEVAGALSGARLAIALSTPEIALATLDALGSGAEGIVAAVHHSDLRRAVTRLPADLCSARPGLSLETATSWVESSFDVLVEVVRLRDGRVRVRRVAELERGSSGALELRDVFRFSVQRVAAGGAVEGSFGPTGHTPRVASQLQAAGIPVEASMFSRPPSR